MSWPKTLLTVWLLIAMGSHCAVAQSHGLKILEYGAPGDSLIYCGQGPYFIEDSIQLLTGVLIDEREIYCFDCWDVYIRELSVSSVASEFSQHVGDTVEIDSCGYLPDSSKAVLKRFESAMGPFKLRRAGASSNPMVPALYYNLIFDEPTKYGRVADYLKAMTVDRDSIIGIVEEGPCLEVLRSIPNDRVFDPRRTTEYLNYDGALDPFWPATISSRTRGWALYSIKAPMAWDVTQGHSDIVIGARDIQSGCSDLSNIDLVIREDVLGTGNIRSTVGTITAAALALTSTPGDGMLDFSMSPLRSTYNVITLSAQHSIETLSAAIARSDNDNLVDPLVNPQGSSIGSAPKCDGTLILREVYGPTYCNGYYSSQRVSSTVAASDVDLDYIDDANDQRAIVDVVYHSYSGGSLGTGGLDAIRRGLVLIASAGNATSTPTPSEPASDVFVSASDHRQDTKVVAVAAISDGSLHMASTCDPWTSLSTAPPVWIGSERFVDGWNYSPGQDKFNADANSSIREVAKQAAFVDLVAPGQDIWVVNNGPRKNRFVSGTSLACPLVAGVVGLMLSVSDHLGTPWDQLVDWPAVPRDVNGPNHQRRAYDILTFTADKILDGNSSFPYTLQTNDKLHRHWAQRMGFGKVNAYRAVAHAVPHKADYEYTTSTNLVFDPNVTNPDGKQLLHMGAKIHDGLDWVLADGRGLDPAVLDNEQLVLEHGGTNIPGEPYQNQGVTRISSNNVNVRTDLTVPTDCLLLADGLVRTVVNPQSNNRIIATNQGSRILMEGYLENIELVGRLTIGDLIIDGTGQAPGLFCNRGSDVYGKVTLLNAAALTISDNTYGATTFRTGSHILLNGTQNLMVRWGGLLELDHSSVITANQGRVVLVEDGTLRVKPGSKVRIDAHVHVWDGQLFEIGDSAVVYIKDLTVNKGATFRVKPGAHVIFGSDDIVINGHLDAAGGSTENRFRIVFSSEVNTNNTNCTFDPRDHAFLAKRTRVRVEGIANATDVVLSSAKAQYCDFMNVSLELKHVRTQPFIFNAFTSRRTSPANMPGNVWNVQPFMLRYESDVSVVGLPTDFYNLTVFNSTFSDVDGNVAPLTPTTLTQDYLISGIRCINGFFADITSNTFTNLNLGAWISGTTTSQIRSNTLLRGDLGILAGYGALLVCDNTFNTVKLPVSGYNLNRSKYFDNMFQTSRVGAYFVNSMTQMFRNNEFNDYWVGINSEASIVSLTSLFQTTSTSPYFAYGRNKFSVPNPALYPNGVGHPNPFTNAAIYAQDVMWLTDLSYRLGAVYLLKCGYNQFSQFATSHLTALWIPPVAVDGSSNNFQPNAVPRTINVAVGGAPWNVSQNYNEMCADDIEQSQCSSGFSLEGTPVLAKISVREREVGTIDRIILRPSTSFVFEQSATTFEHLASTLAIACGSAVEEYSFHVYSLTNTSVTLATQVDLYTYLQSASPGVYTLQAQDPVTGICSILMLVLR